MNTRQLGRTGLQVTVLGYGAGQLRATPRIWNGRPVSDEQAERILNAVLDAGINFIDTASIYGRSEEFIGRFIGHRRDEYLIATKFGCQLKDMGSWDDTPRNWSPDFLRDSIDESLRRLRTDRVDLLQLHTPTYDDFVRYDLVRPLEDARAAGKARFIGLSVTEPQMTAFAPHFDAFDTVQLPYSAYEMHYGSWLTKAAAHGLGTIIRGGAAQGKAEQGGADGLWERAGLDDLLDGETRTAFVLRFTLSHPDVHTAIVATIDPDHLRDNVAAAERGVLPADVLAEAKHRLSAALAPKVPQE
ncbi:MAG: aldo/keto reductase [Chloroflexi bacterium]|nr:aldo/keto reductase [Chloroflexota bacterium]